MTPELKCLWCCAGITLALVFACLVLIAWSMCHVAALDRIIGEATDEPTP